VAETDKEKESGTPS